MNWDVENWKWDELARKYSYLCGIDPARPASDKTVVVMGPNIAGLKERIANLEQLLDEQIKRNEELEAENERFREDAERWQNFSESIRAHHRAWDEKRHANSRALLTVSNADPREARLGHAR